MKYWVIECGGFQGVVHYRTYDEALAAANFRNSFTKRRWTVKEIYCPIND